MSKTLTIFLAYSRKDTEYLDELRTHFTPLERSGKVTIWYDGKIEPGTVWELEIKKRLHNSDIILLLVSASAIASDYFYEEEMKDALKRHEEGTAKVIPFILRPCAWKATPLAKLQVIPRDGKAITTWNDRDEGYSDAVNRLWELIINVEKTRKEKLETEQKAREEKIRNDKLKAAQKAREEQVRKEKLETEQKAREEKIRSDKLKAAQKAREEKVRKEKLETEQKVREEKIRNDKLKVAQKAREEKELKQSKIVTRANLENNKSEKNIEKLANENKIDSTITSFVRSNLSKLIIIPLAILFSMYIFINFGLLKNNEIPERQVEASKHSNQKSNLAEERIKSQYDSLILVGNIELSKGQLIKANEIFSKALRIGKGTNLNLSVAQTGLAKCQEQKKKLEKTSHDEENIISGMKTKNIENSTIKIGKHIFGAQKFRFDTNKYGYCLIENENGLLRINGIQKSDNGKYYLKINGIITEIINSNKFLFKGYLDLNALPKYKECNKKHNIEAVFYSAGDRKYWRLQNPVRSQICSSYTFYFDIFK